MLPRPRNKTSMPRKTAQFCHCEQRSCVAICAYQVSIAVPSYGAVCLIGICLDTVVLIIIGKK